MSNLAPPNDCTLDPLGLFTHGVFRCFTSPNPCLNLFTHGEFPRAAFVEAPGGVGAQVDGGTGGKRQRRRRIIYPEIVYDQEDEIIALTILLADDEDDWW